MLTFRIVKLKGMEKFGWMFVIKSNFLTHTGIQKKRSLCIPMEAI
jgi:hypothetical protein